jgi:hypothetical protein
MTRNMTRKLPLFIELLINQDIDMFSRILSHESFQNLSHTINEQTVNSLIIAIVTF